MRCSLPPPSNNLSHPLLNPTLHHAHIFNNQVDFTAPEPIASEGSDETRAYIRAFYVNVPGLFAQSEVFTLEPAW